MNLVLPVRDYIDSLVHASARDNPLAAARHRNFIAPRIVGGFLALALLPTYLLARGSLTAPEAVVFGWLLAPIAIACFLAHTGRYEHAQALSSMAFAAVVLLVGAMSGGLSSPASIWLLVIPLEAALCASRRVILAATGFAAAAAGGLWFVGPNGLALAPASAEGAAAILWAISLGGAIAYAGLLALGVASLAHTGSRLLMQEEERYRLLALNMTDVISRHDQAGRTLFISPAAEQLFGVPARELIGHGLFDRVHVADRPAYLTALSEAAAGRGSGSLEFRARRSSAAGGREPASFMWLEMRCRNLPASDDGGGDERGNEVVAVMRDVSERKAQEQTIAEARSEAERANAAKSRFLATMSHELRTPLNAVIGFSEMLMNESAMQLDAARRHDYARLIHDSGQHLLSVVNLVLDMSKIETGNFVIVPEPFDPAAVIRHCCELLGLKAGESGLEIVVDVPSDLPEIVGDKRAMKQMLFNLLSNAMKFTPRGGTVVVRAHVDGAELVISIEDTGVGISETDLPRLGDPFFQAHAAYDRPYEGTGLGLSIVKGLVELHGGRLQVDSKLGVGTRASIRLPLDCEQRNAAAVVVDLNGTARRPSGVANAAPAVQADAEVKKRA